MNYRKLTGILALSISMSCLFPAAAIAEGPGDGGVLSSQAGGPGEMIGQNTDGNSSAAAGNDLSQLESSNPIVQTGNVYTYEQMVNDITNLKARYGGKMRVNSYGTSLDGRTLYEIVIGNENAGKHVLIQAGIHGREHMTPLLVMKQLETALEFSDSASYRGESVKDMLGQVQVHFFPMVNPDGVAISQQGLAAVHSYDFQQTIQDGHAKDMAESRTATPFDLYLPYWKGNARGVDLNVNFPANWENIISSPGHASYTGYKGTSPGSEPESAALMKAANSHGWSASVSYHSRGEVIYWDFPGNKVKDASRELAQIFADESGYRILGSDGKGGFKDWMQIKDNPVPSITVETGTKECPMPVSEWPRVWSRNKTGWAAALYYAWQH